MYKLIKKYMCNFPYMSGLAKSTGRLNVSVHNKLNNEPVPFASVSLYYLVVRGPYLEQGEATLIVRHITNENGDIPIIELPVLDRNVPPIQ